jgi:hypothetical protein
VVELTVCLFLGFLMMHPLWPYRYHLLASLFAVTAIWSTGAYCYMYHTQAVVRLLSRNLQPCVELTRIKVFALADDQNVFMSVHAVARVSTRLALAMLYGWSVLPSVAFSASPIMAILLLCETGSAFPPIELGILVGAFVCLLVVSPFELVRVVLTRQ